MLEAAQRAQGRHARATDDDAVGARPVDTSKTCERVVAGHFVDAVRIEQFGIDPPFRREDVYKRQVRVLYDITERWDFGVQASGLFSSGGRQYGLGLETGYAIVDNLWASVGYNFIGFSDDDLVESDYTRRGIYLRLRFKFDEKLFRGRDRQWNNSLSATTPDGQQN